MCAWCYADDWTMAENSGKRACHFPGSMLTGNEAANPSHGRCACGLRKPRSVKTPLSGQYVCYPSTKHSKRHLSSQSAIVGASWPHHKTRALRAGSLSRSPTRVARGRGVAARPAVTCSPAPSPLDESAPCNESHLRRPTRDGEAFGRTRTHSRGIRYLQRPTMRMSSSRSAHVPHLICVFRWWTRERAFQGNPVLGGLKTQFFFWPAGARHRGRCKISKMSQ